MVPEYNILAAGVLLRCVGTHIMGMTAGREGGRQVLCRRKAERHH
jgi:hypothetical protein